MAGVIFTDERGGAGAALFPPARDAAFGKSLGGMIWPRGFVGAAAFWNYNASVDPRRRRLRRRDLEDERRAAPAASLHVPEQVRLRSGERVRDAVRLSGEVE